MIDKDIEIVKSIIKSEKFDLEVEEKFCIDKDTYKVKGIKNRISALENVLSELEKKDNIIFETKKYLENMTKSSIRDKDGYYLGNWYVLQPYELEEIIDILKGNYNDE